MAKENIGFDREEMHSSDLSGDKEPPHVHLFVAYGTHETWQAKLQNDQDAPVAAFKKAFDDALGGSSSGKEISFSVTAIPVSEQDQEGDVLIFPQRLRVKNGVESAVEIAQGVVDGGVEDLVKKVQPLEHGGYVFICCHTARDARCGHCGPLLVDAVKKQAAKEKNGSVWVKACSHVGGHRYAPNAVIFKDDDSATCDWLGYLTDSPKDAKHIIDLALNRVDEPHPSHWRGRRGLTKAEHKEKCQACQEGGDIEDIQSTPPKVKPNVLFVLGGPGAGKGTQCELITRDYGFTHLSAGDLLRAERQNKNSKNGKLIEQYIKDGKIVPVEITVQLLLDAMDKSDCDNFLIDGFPRNADNLDGWKRVVKDNAKVLGCLFFDCPEEVMESRLLERGKTSGRSDDNIESIRKRFRTYINDTRPIIDLFEARGKTFRVISDRPVEQVYADTKAVLGGKLGFKQIPKVLFVLGGPGAGKGTQCERITKEYAFTHLSAGDLLRAERQNKASKNGQLIEQYIKDGKIVPVEITVKLLLDAMCASKSDNFLIDGFPRNADNLDGWNRVVGAKAHVLGCLFFDCPQKVMETRLLERGKTSGRSDDNIESIRKRFNTYVHDTKPIIDSFAAKQQCFHIISDRSVDAVYGDVERVLEETLAFTKTPNVLFVLGGPGAGKGTQCEYITAAFPFDIIGAGDLLRAERNDKSSKNGQLIDQYIKEGKIVPVEITVQLLLNAMNKSKFNNFLVDGFPRNADNLDGWNRVVGNKANVLGCLFFDCKEDVMEARLLERGKTSGRADDNIESIRKRFRTYQNDTMPIIKRFHAANRCWTFDANQPKEQIRKQVFEVMLDVTTAPPKQGFSSVPCGGLLQKIKTMPPIQKVALGAAGAAVLLFIGMRVVKSSKD
mmetsp:Transcript_2288/g.4424  ORF Transcript_2288/g.4424 Transcript_2288/m.4424 type:complete len:893 (+) Transcript_2288:142-2820(+)